MKCDDCKKKDAKYALRRMGEKLYLFYCSECLFNFARAEYDEEERLG